MTVILRYFWGMDRSDWLFPVSSQYWYHSNQQGKSKIPVESLLYGIHIGNRFAGNIQESLPFQPVTYHYLLSGHEVLIAVSTKITS